MHSTPWEPRGDLRLPARPLLARFGEADADFVLYGHTHHQLVQRFGGVLVINPGSAGEARDHRQRPAIELCGARHRESEEVVVIDFPDRPAPIREI